MKKIINSENAPKPIGPYNQAILSNRTLYVSGQIPLNPQTGKIVKGDIKEETKQVMENIGAILKDGHMDFSNVVKCSIFIKDIKQFSEINEIYKDYFDSNYYPARETIQVAALPMNANIEISVIAVQY